MLEFLAADTRYFVLLSITARTANLDNPNSTSRSLLPMMSTSSTYPEAGHFYKKLYLKPAAQMLLSIRMLKKSNNRESACLRPRLVSKGSDKGWQPLRNIVLF